MKLFFFSFAGMLLAFGAMALGVWAGRGPLRRGCGSWAEGRCAGCTRPPGHTGPPHCAHREGRA